MPSHLSHIDYEQIAPAGTRLDRCAAPHWPQHPCLPAHLGSLGSVCHPLELSVATRPPAPSPLLTSPACRPLPATSHDAARRRRALRMTLTASPLATLMPPLRWRLPAPPPTAPTSAPGWAWRGCCAGCACGRASTASAALSCWRPRRSRAGARPPSGERGLGPATGELGGWARGARGPLCNFVCPPRLVAVTGAHQSTDLTLVRCLPACLVLQRRGASVGLCPGGAEAVRPAWALLTGAAAAPDPQQRVVSTRRLALLLSWQPGHQQAVSEHATIDPSPPSSLYHSHPLLGIPRPAARLFSWQHRSMAGQAGAATCALVRCATSPLHMPNSSHGTLRRSSIIAFLKAGPPRLWPACHSLFHLARAVAQQLALSLFVCPGLLFLMLWRRLLPRPLSRAPSLPLKCIAI